MKTKVEIKKNRDVAFLNWWWNWKDNFISLKDQKLKIGIKKIWTKLKNKIKGQPAIFIEWRN